MKRMGLIAGVLVLIAALVYVNKSISQVAKPDNDDAPPPKSSQPKTPPAPNRPGPPDPTADALAPETTINDPAKAQYKITVGWVYDEETLADPTPLSQALGSVRQMASASGGRMSVEIVDLDVPSEDLSPAAQTVGDLGIALNGKPVGASVNPGQPGLTVPQIGAAIGMATGHP